MGNCVSSQSQQAVVEKQAATGRGRSIVSLRKAAMEKYPVPTKNRLVLGNEGTTGGLSNNSSCSNNAPAGTQQTNDAGNNDITQLRSKLRPPSVIIARPVSIQLTNKSGIDTNGNIPRPSSLPRLLKTSDNNATAKIESLQQQQQAKPSNLTGCATFRTVSLDSKNRTILNPPPVVSASSNKTSTASKDSRSVSPSPSSMSIASSFGSNKSHSVADSGIATCSSSRSQSTISERKSALSLKFGFFTKKTAGATETKKANVDRINSANSILTATPPPSSAVSKLRGTCELPRQTKSPRPTSLRLSSSVTVGSAGVQRVTGRIQQPATHKSPARMPTPQLTSIKNRAALVLGRSKSSDYKSVELRPRLSVEAIVASLEQEIRHQLGPEPPPLALSPKKEVKEISTPVEKVEVERFGIETASKAQIEFVDEDEDEDFIEDIELQLQTPSSAAECQPSPEGDDQSRDEGHHGDEEDSNATSISDAMIDDEIADQPGLVMLGQVDYCSYSSYSVPASPMHSWRSELFHYNLPPMSMINYPPSEDDQSDVSSYHHRLVRRRVASVSDIDDGLKESPVAAATASSSSPVAPADGIRASTMRAELFNSPSSKHRESSSTSYWPPSEATIVIELEEYTSMANELADIKSQLITLQNLLVETVADGGSNCGGIDPPGSHTAPLWDLKRDLVLLREELQEKNTTIKTLKNQLRAVNGRTSVNKNKESTATTKASASCNVATQTDRPRSGAFTNGLSPSDNDEVQLVSSTKLKLPTVSGLPVRSRPIRLTTK
ncbi:uncharacterized protein LOC124316169 isoform X4 [Daphnia pulicaria]|nr:uncharacterized protein LOC124316169 isoform X4 [Daphnia pulicaria]XP_046637912.1 uncharacterized protein LOC124316169 isoform X4 [Daphnia pulicaria]